MFVWMGEILFRTKLSEELFNGLAPWVRRIPGRLLHVNILACGIFGSVSGSSAATCATVSKIALPELRRRGYDERTAIGSLATAGTLGIMIPPSIIMVVYAVAAEVSIVRVFLAGMHPRADRDGAVQPLHRRLGGAEPGAPAAGRAGHGLRRRSCGRARSSSRARLLIIGVIGSMFVGWATATEAAAFGVAGQPAARRRHRHAVLAELPRQPGRRDAAVLHDHVHPGRRRLPDQGDGADRHPGGAGAGRGRAGPRAVRHHRHPHRRLHRARHGARRRFDDRAHHLDRGADRAARPASTWCGSASSSCCWWRSPRSRRRSASTSSSCRP